MSHPYKTLEATALWQVVDTALAELERNRDVTLGTSRALVIGYLCRQLSDHFVGERDSFQREVK
jgi:hypothetical protein